jgi:hypothetical protein
MIFKIAPLSPVSDGPVFAAPDRKIEGGWAAFYAFLPRRKSETRSALQNERMALRMLAQDRGCFGNSEMTYDSSFLPVEIPSALSLR